MANVFKRLTGTPTRRAKKKGNLTRGIGVENYGPTSQTGYYASAIPPSNGYLITSINSNNLPEYRVANNDTDLINFANDLGGNVSTAIEAKAFLQGRPDTLLIDSTLILNINLADTASYSGTGNIIYDLSGNQNNLTIYGTSPHDGYSIGVGLNSSTTSYVQSNPFPFPTNDYTLILTLKVNFNQSNAIFSYEKSGNGNTSLLYAPGGGINFYGPSGAVGMSYTLPSNKWFQIARVRTKSGGSEKMYVNGKLVSSKTLASNVSTPTGGSLNIGQEQDSQGGSFDSGQTTNGYLANAKIYSKALTENEIRNNFYKGNIVVDDNLILHLDPANPVCFEPGADVCYNTVTGGIVTGANGTPYANTHTPNPNMFPAHNTVYGGVFDFAGGRGMNVDEDLGSTTTSTLSMWIYKNSASTQYFSDARNNGGQWYLSNYSSYNITYTNALAYNYGGSYNSSNSNFLNKWIHITVTSDNSGSKLYLNGVLTTGGNRSSLDEDFGKNFRIGTRYTTSSNWTGYMGPIMAYNRVLSADEVKQNFNAHRGRFGI